MFQDTGKTISLTLPISAHEGGVLVAVLVIVALSLAVYAILSRDKTVMRLPEGWTMTALTWFAVLLAPIWAALILFVLWQFVRLGAVAFDLADGETMRWHVLSLVGLLTGLAGLVGAPMALIRVFTTERQTIAAEEGLITERITKAVAGLGAQKEVNRLGRSVRYTQGGRDHSYFEWMDAPQDPPEHDTDQTGKRLLTNDPWANVALTKPNLEVRIGSIYALERIAQDSPRDHVQIMEILCAYIRENAPASGAKPFTDPDTGEEMPDWEPLVDDAGAEQRAAHNARRRKRFGRGNFASKAWKWARMLKPRTDIQIAATVIGRRSEDQIAREIIDLRHGKKGYQLDLRACDLQGVDLAKRDLRYALLSGARIEGADLSGARMQGAHLLQARMEGADLSEARMERANLSGARMEGANLRETRIEGAFLSEARMEGANLLRAQMEGAYLRGARMEGADLREARMEGARLSGARMDAPTSFSPATLRGAGLRDLDFTNVIIEPVLLDEVFFDDSVKLPPDFLRPDEGRPKDVLNWRDYISQWHAFQEKIGYVPPKH